MTKLFSKRLVEIQREYPELTFQNNGYEYLSQEVYDRHPEQVAEINRILKLLIPGFSKFNNFKMSEKGDKCFVRVQHYWDSTFKGVGYFELNEEIYE